MCFSGGDIEMSQNYGRSLSKEKIVIQFSTLKLVEGFDLEINKGSKGESKKKRHKAKWHELL